jgi:hypothetical protein
MFAKCGAVVDIAKSAGIPRMHRALAGVASVASAMMEMARMIFMASSLARSARSGTIARTP